MPARGQAEELPPPTGSLSEAQVGRAVPRLLSACSGLPVLFFQPIPVGASGALPFSQEAVPEVLGPCVPRCWGNSLARAWGSEVKGYILLILGRIEAAEAPPHPLTSLVPALAGSRDSDC